MCKNYGYVRVSSRDQHPDRQIAALLANGVSRNRIFTETVSGKDFCRPVYLRLMKKLRPGDALFVKAIDRLGRNYDEILEQWRVITREKQADIVVLDMPLLDTRKKDDNLTGVFVADLTLQILSYVAETERRNIKARQAEGIAAAKARGVKFGNPGKPLPDQFDSVVKQWRAKKISLEEALLALNVSRSYFYSHAKELGL